MPTSPTAPPTVSTLSSPPSRATDSATAYANKADTTMSEIPPMVTSQNSLATWQEDTATEVYNNAVEANTSAANSSASAAESLQYSQDAAASANYEGVWSSLTGAYNKGISVFNDGAFWRLNVNLADITASEPSPANVDWAFDSGTRWLSYTASFTANANSISYILATSAAVDITQPTFTANDFVVFKNSSDSTQTVKILNPSNTLVFRNGSITAGDNAVINPGDTVSLLARTSTILERF